MLRILDNGKKLERWIEGKVENIDVKSDISKE